jgi:hypothetical protein
VPTLRLHLKIEQLAYHASKNSDRIAGILITATISLYPYYYAFTLCLHQLQKFHPVFWGVVAEIAVYRGF